MRLKTPDRAGGYGWWPWVALGLVGAAYLWEILTLSGIPVARDVQMFFVPQKHLLWEALQRGEVPLWTPYIGNGSPFLANVQSGVFYPPNWAYAALPFFPTFNLLLVLHFVLGGAFAFALARRLGLERVPAYVAAATWMFGGYFASLLNLINALQAAAWAPAVAWAAARLVDENDRPSAVVLVVVVSLSALAGEPQSFLFSAGVAAVVAIGRLTERRPGRGELAEMTVKLAIAAVVVLGLIAIQVLPTLEMLRESSREGGLTYGEAAAFSLHPARLIHFLVPTDYRDPEYAFGVRSVLGVGDPWLFSTYLGALWPLLLWAAWRNRRRRFQVAVWSAVALGSIVMALGDHTPVFPWLFDHVPGVGAFRFPEKYLFGTAFASMLIAGWGAEDALARRPDRRDAFFALTYLALLAAGLGLFLTARETVREFASQYGNDRMMVDFGFAYGVWAQNLIKLVVIVAVAIAAAWLHARRALRRTALATILCLLVTADLAVAHRDLNPVVERSFYEDQPLIFDDVPLQEVRRDFRLRVSRFDSLAGTVPVIRGIPLSAQKWVWQQISAPNIGQYWGVLQQDAWDAIKLARIRDERDIHRVLPEPERRWALLRLHSVKYVHSILDIDPAGEAVRIPTDSIPGTLYRIERPLPRAYVVPLARWLPDNVAVINEVLGPGFDPRATVILEGEPPSGGAPRSGEPVPVPNFPGASITRAGDDEVRVRVETSGPGYLVLTDNHYPGWLAEVDGERRPIRLANFFFRAVELRPGDREVVFRYRSPAFERGRLASAITLAAVLLWLAVVMVRDRKRPEGR